MLPGKLRYDGRDLDLSRTIVKNKAYVMDYESGLYYPIEECYLLDGQYYHRSTKPDMDRYDEIRAR